MNKKTATLALITTALALGVSACATKSSSPNFQASEMGNGYNNGEKTADAKCGNGSCGSNTEKSEDAKCGSNHAKSDDGKGVDASCGSKDSSSSEMKESSSQNTDTQ